MEIWKDIDGYEGIYQISNKGNVRSLDRILSNNRYIKGINLKPKYDKDGYCSVVLSKNGVQKHRRVHQLVCMAFVENPNSYTMINHKNGIRDDNDVTNLEWCDNSYNQWHRCHVNNNPPNNDYKKKQVKAIFLNGEEHLFDSVTLCSEWFGVSRTSIERKLKGKSPNPSFDKRKHTIVLYGVKFEYVV